VNYRNHFEKLKLLKNKKLSLQENVEDFLQRIEKNKSLNAYNFVFNESVKKEAERVQKKIDEGKAGKAAGMVLAVKDVLGIKDNPLTCSSNILRDFRSLYTSTAVQKLLDEDAIIVGKTNCDEFAMGSSNENSAFGQVKNPVDENKVPGGSSGGSAAAMAADLCDVALGTDTGGSIRQPAAFVGTYGLKPTYGRVSRYGLTAFASSFDSIGPFAKSVEDIALTLEIMSGKDENDSTSQEIDVPAFSKELENGKDTFKIGLPKEFFEEGLSPEIKDTINSFIEKLKENGFGFEEVSLPNNEYAVSTYYILTTAEASSNLARYDGARYGYRSDKVQNLNDMYTNSRSEGFGKEVKRRIMLGTYVLSSGYYDAYYRKAQKVRRLIKEDFDSAFEKVDILLAPTTPTTACSIGEKSDDPLQMYLSDIYTTSANLAGIPAINIPIGKDSAGLPIGMQLMADQFEETKLLQMSYQLQKLLNK
jgi:aspartyl-tRNA(Asn)/glutamyl-tRNA(Gln) amidotransferase subunit A